MTSEQERFLVQIKTKEAVLVTALKRREGIEVESAPDVYDESQLAVERELVIHGLDRESALLRDVRGAIRRLKEGTYGVCLRCEMEIGAKRLNAVPWAPLCLECQEKADSEGPSGDNRIISRLTEAA